MAVNGWHRGEAAIRAALNFDKDPFTRSLFSYIEGGLPPDHGQFHSTRLPFLPVTTLDEQGRPWGSILSAADGRPGFIRNLKYSTLTASIKLINGDPLEENLKQFGNGSALIAGIGIEFSSRRRNKFAGKITKVEQKGDSVEIQLTVNQAIGNCPKYINVRTLLSHPQATAQIAHRELTLDPTARLPESIISFIHEMDTVFLGTTYAATGGESVRFPSHLGMNQRGGRPGFVRVRPSDGRTLVLPDYSGNRFMTSLGNVEATPLASLTFVSFTSGDILYITGDAENLYGEDARKVMNRQNLITLVRTTGYVLVRDALTVRQQSGTEPSPSPYSPPIKLLVEEASKANQYFDKSQTIDTLLTKLDLLSPNILRLSFETSKSVQIKPGQAVVLDLTPLLGAQEYQHMAPYNPSSINDDRIRTWTVSSAHTKADGTTTFDITMRHKQGGAITGAFFNIAQRLKEVNPAALADTRPLQLTSSLVGISGDFTLPDACATTDATTTKQESSLVSSLEQDHPNRRLLWFAGGIGITPFLSMLTALASTSTSDWDITFILSTRQPQVLLPLVEAALSASEHVGVTLHVFSTADVPDVADKEKLKVVKHSGRVSGQFIRNDLAGVVGNGDVYVCGPVAFEKAVTHTLVDMGVPEAVIRREGFEY